MPPGGIPTGGQLNQAHGIRWGDGSDPVADTVFFDTLGNFIVHVGQGNGSLVLPGGQVLRSGTGVPAAGLGDNGDVYFDKAGAANAFFYKKSGGAWSLLSGGSGGGGTPSGPAGGSLAGNYPNPTFASGAATGAALGTDVVVTGASAQTKTGTLTVPLGILSGAGLPTSSNVPASTTAVWKNTTTGEPSLYVNDSGTIKNVGQIDWLVATDYGADPTGTNDSTTAINNAIAALPVTGGTVYIPAGNYKINGTINIGNGSSSGVSTRSGIILRGCAPAGISQLTSVVPGNGQVGATRLFSGAAPAIMILVNGPIQGWGIQDLYLDGVDGAHHAYGLYEVAAQGGRCSNVSFANFQVVGQHTSALAETGALSAVAGNNMHNSYYNFMFQIPGGINFSRAIECLDNGVDTSTNTGYDLWDHLVIVWAQPTPSGKTQYGIQLQGCDNVVFRHVEMFGTAPASGGTTYALYFDYTGKSNGWPADCLFDDIDFGTNSAGVVFNQGSPGASATVNRVTNISSTNGQPPNPLLANLSFGLPILPHGGEFINPTAAASAVVWRVVVPCKVLGVYGFRTGGTGATINASHSGNKLLASDLSLTSTSTWVSGGTVQNATLAVGEDLTILLQSESGSPSGVAIQVDVQGQ